MSSQQEEINPFQLEDDDDADADTTPPPKGGTTAPRTTLPDGSSTSDKSRSDQSPPTSSAGGNDEAPWASESSEQPILTSGANAPSSDHASQAYDDGSRDSHDYNNGGRSSRPDKQDGKHDGPARHQPIPAPQIDMSAITILEAQKTTDHVGASSFIVYVIRCDGTEAKRRYSEFEALRSSLVQLYPTLIIPPIPSKHALGDYVVKQSKAKEDATIIARRKRMLQSFLRRCASHPELEKSEVLRKFLDGRWSWHEINTTPPISNLPKSNLRAPAANPADREASPAYASLPIPSSSSVPLRNPSQRFLDSEAFTNRFANHLSGSLEKANRRVARRWGDASGDFAELGAVLNGFSLSESGQLATAIERTGQASDSTFMSIGGLLQDWEQSMTEPLHEYVQFAAILQKLLKWRHLKHLQYELAQDALEAKKVKLEELERVEAEAKRLERALETGGRSLTSDAGGRGSSGGLSAWDSGYRGGKSSIYGGAVEGDDDESTSAGRQEPAVTKTTTRGEAGWSDGITDSSPQADSSESSRSKTSGDRRRPTSTSSSSGGGYGLLSALSHTFSSVLDVDPESTRRREISRLREDIASLDEALQLTAQDLKYATSHIQADLDRFQRMKIKDLKEMMLNSARMHREFCRVNLQNWQEAQQEISKIERKVSGVGGDNATSTSEWPSLVMPESSLTRREQQLE